MSSNNDNGETTGLAIVFASLVFIGVFLYAVLAFLACALTVIAIIAWNKPFTLGKMTVYPANARAFVGRGIIGAIALPVFLVFCELLFNLRIDWDAYLVHILLGGYTFGSIVLEMMADAETPQPDVPEYLPPAVQIPAPPQPASEPKEFRFASWDDEADHSDRSKR